MVEFDDGLVDIHTTGNFCKFCQFAKFANLNTYTVFYFAEETLKEPLEVENISPVLTVSHFKMFKVL
jgi:hypothetical protein